MSLSNYLENLVGEWLRNVDMPPAPDQLYLALMTSDPGEAGGGTEVSGGAYARQPITLTATPMPLSNVAPISYPLSTAPWGFVEWVKLMDAVAGGNTLAYSHLAEQYQKNVLINDIVEFPVGAVIFNLD